MRIISRALCQPGGIWLRMLDLIYPRTKSQKDGPRDFRTSSNPSSSSIHSRTQHAADPPKVIFTRTVQSLDRATGKLQDSRLMSRSSPRMAIAEPGGYNRKRGVWRSTWACCVPRHFQRLCVFAELSVMQELEIGSKIYPIGCAFSIASPFCSALSLQAFSGDLLFNSI